METLKMTQALDERDYLKKKIISSINELDVITAKRNLDKLTRSGDTPEDFEKKAKANYQSLIDNIDRYNRICAAIVQSNAESTITVAGKEMTRAKAIELKKRMKDGDHLELALFTKLNALYTTNLDNYNRLTNQLADRKERYIESMIDATGDKNKTLSDEDLKVVDKMMESYEPQLIDPLNLKDIIDNMKADIENFAKEIETAIKISNATTDVTF